MHKSSRQVGLSGVQPNVYRASYCSANCAFKKQHSKSSQTTAALDNNPGCGYALSGLRLEIYCVTIKLYSTIQEWLIP